MSTAADFPFYAGTTERFGARQWGLVLAGVVLGFAALIVPMPWSTSRYGQFIPALLFVAIPLMALALATPRHWSALFRRVGGRDVGVMLLIALLSLIVSAVVGVLVMKLHGAESNPVFTSLAAQSSSERVLFFLKTVPQLLGEELVTVLPLLALMALFHGPLGLSRRNAIVLAWLLSALIFGALHLPTYGWNLVQSFLVIGSARLVLSLAYLWTKNLWVSAGAHILNDWALFGLGLLLSGLAAG